MFLVSDTRRHASCRVASRSKQNDFTSRSRSMALATPGFHLSDAGQLSTTRLAAKPHLQ